MNNDHIAKAEVQIDAPARAVWEALTTPEIIKEYMFGATVVSDWNVDSTIVWKGEWEGKPYEDKGVILEIEPEKVFTYTHYTPVSGDADVPENYHKVTTTLEEMDAKTHVILTQEGNSTEEVAERSTKNWNMMLEGLKKVVEGT